MLIAAPEPQRGDKPFVRKLGYHTNSVRHCHGDLNPQGIRVTPRYSLSARKYAFDTYCETMRWVLKKEPFMAMAERITFA